MINSIVDGLLLSGESYNAFYINDLRQFITDLYIDENVPINNVLSVFQNDVRKRKSRITGDNIYIDSTILYIWLSLGGTNEFVRENNARKKILLETKNFSTNDLNKIAGKIKKNIGSNHVIVEYNKIIISNESYDTFIKKCMTCPLKIRNREFKLCL